LSFVTLLALGSAAIAFRFARSGYAYCHPKRTAVTPEEQAAARAAFPALEEVSFTAPDKVRLYGWFIPPSNGLVVVMTHGLWGNRAYFLPEAEVFVRHGYGALIYDSRAHGTSEGSVATWGDRETGDVMAAVTLASGRPGVSRVVLLGFSVGALAVAHAAAEDPRVRAVILYATWTSLRDEIQHKAGGPLQGQLELLGFRWSGVRVDAVHPIDVVARIAPRPLLMIAGQQDPDTPPSVMERVFAAAREPKEIWRQTGVGHGGYLQAAPAEYESRVIGFLDRAFGR
jgi:pimeloyl-ACP methyl ester carboxylesterase